MAYIMGLDIGGANTKVCCLDIVKGMSIKAGSSSVYHEMWREPDGLRNILYSFKKTAQSGLNNLDGIALTMTAELCDGFKSKTQGVLSIIEMVEDIFDGVPIYVWTTQGSFVNSYDLKKNPLSAAAANWLASALAIAQSSLLESGSAILADMGSTTTDILPLAFGKVLVKGRTDTERLMSGELLYTGVLRTAVDSIVTEVYLDGLVCPVVHEYFAITADVYRFLGFINEGDYNVPTPDGGERDAESCAKRLARLVASEPGNLGLENIYLLARYVMEKQIGQIIDNILRLISRKNISFPEQLITAGQGSFILKEIARRLGLKEISWWEAIPGAKPEFAMTSYTVAWLLSQELSFVTE